MWFAENGSFQRRWDVISSLFPLLPVSDSWDVRHASPQISKKREKQDLLRSRSQGALGLLLRSPRSPLFKNFSPGLELLTSRDSQ